ncbi:hypothetical protein [Hymenobacter ruricola]|uniref:DUF4177 domain-containing protein n=1 Tax=Hymenobacter ruricola TaxID=2791023 RepID=A0ABS0I825_9BACT|nr:hypothetical protein [Hymenobacter ruricola]MBF9223118.1 hypothetical protein [Hymenobacter ruricola]
MKTTLHLLAVTACALALSRPACAQTPAAAPSKTVVLRAYESPANKIYICYGEGHTETEITVGPYGKKDQLRDIEQLQRVVDRLYTNGYRIVSATTGGVSDQQCVTYILRRD